MFCEKCGMKLPNDAKFCEQCGNAILDFSMEENETKKIPNKRELHKVNTYVKEPIFKQKRTMIIFVIVGIVVGIMGLAILARLFFFSSEAEEFVDIENENASEAKLPQEESDFFETYEFELENKEKVDDVEYSEMNEVEVLEELTNKDDMSEYESAEGEKFSVEDVLNSNNNIGDEIETQQQSSVEFDSELDVEAEVKQIREWYYHPTSHETKHVLEKGTDGWNYAREYYFHDGELYFAFIFNGSEEHRLYFKNDIMIRYIDEGRQTFDYGNLETYSWWEKQALNESRQFIQ